MFSYIWTFDRYLMYNILMVENDHKQLASSQPGLFDKERLGGQAGLATYVAAKIFGSPSLPSGMPDWLQASVESQANFAQRLPGSTEMTIGGAGGGSLSIKAKQEREEDADAEATESFRTAADRMDRQREIERQHEAQWSTESHSYAGQTLTGTEWRGMIDWFRDGANVEAWEDRMMAETGESREEVRRTGGKMKRFYDLMDKDAKGTLTKDEQAEFTTLQQDHELRRGLEVQQELQQPRNELGHDQTQESDARLSGSQKDSIAGRSDLYADASSSAKGLAAVQPLSPIYQRATDTVSAPEQVQTLQSAAPVAANTITVSPANMFG